METEIVQETLPAELPEKPEDRPLRTRDEMVAVIKVLADECINMQKGNGAAEKYTANIAIIGALSWAIQYTKDEDVFDCVLGAGAYIGDERRRAHPIDSAVSQKPLIQLVGH